MLGEDLRLTGVAALALLLAALLGGCGTAPAPAPAPSSSAPLPTPMPRPTHAVAAPEPRAGACHTLTYQQALASTAPSAEVPCTRTHTAQTYAVGRIDDVVDGHLLAVDSTRVQHQVASSCPASLPGYLGRSADALRLTMLRAVWFTPTLDQAAAGARWYRCDVVVLSGSTLAPLTAPLKGVLSSPRAGQYAMCGTAKPGAPGFQRVPCSAPHTWKALSVVPLAAGPYPGQQAVQAAGTAQCQQAAANTAPNALDYQWGYDWPSAQQWAAGQTYGVCWAPS